MQYIIKNPRPLAAALLATGLFVQASLRGQSTYLPQDHSHSHLLERLEIRLQRNGLLNVSTAKPLSRRLVAEFAEELPAGADLSAVDRNGVQRLLANTAEWVKGDKQSFKSK